MRALVRTLAVATLTLGGLLSAPILPGSPALAESGTAAGTLIAATAHPDGWHQLWGGSSLEYWTTRSNGEPVRASGALFVPAGTPPAGGWPIMAWDHGTTGMGPASDVEKALPITVPSPLHAALAAQFAANGVDFSTVVGTGGHTELNPQMWAAMDAFTDRVFAAPTVS
ncbi:hypothetical protein ACQP06_31170 [Nocardia sp. CA-136227]|uniref:hypothetical protein n=1 Tax=Nocardia sp. CA-136227 TaxID=3239979 RepID=UPI003D95BCBB